MVEQRATSHLASPAFPQVHLPGVGMVSMAPLDELRDARDNEQANANHLAWQSVELEGQAEDRMADAGALMVPRRAWWEVRPELFPRVAEAERLVARVLLLDSQIARLEQAPQPKTRHVLSKVGGWVRERVARTRRVRAAAQLREALVLIARTGAAAAVRVPDVAPLIEEATELQARAERLRVALAATSSRLAELNQEIAMREQADQSMGFDSLYLAANFTQHGLPAIRSPFQLEAGELAYLATDAELARVPMGGTQLATSGPGYDVPVTHSGIRHWIGDIRGRSALQQSVTPIDRGTLVVSSIRLVFIGGAESVALPLVAVVDIEVYADAIAVSRLGTDEPEIFMVTAPRQVAFYLNWAIAYLAGAESHLF